MPSNREIVERYIDGFRQTDHDQILSCLGDGIVWELHGMKTVRGKADFDAEIEAGGSAGPPTLVLDRLLEDGETVVACGHGSVLFDDQDARSFVFCEVFDFAAGKIEHLTTYHVWSDPR